MQQVIIITFSLLILLTIVSADEYDIYYEEQTTSSTYDTSFQQYGIAEEPTPEYYPTQTDPAPGVMYDYRTPSYDIYSYDLAPQD